MKKQEKFISCNCLWLGIAGIYLNFMVFLFTDYSIWYFLGLIPCIGILVCVINGLQRRNK